jgi:antitoxin component HigA of HigAB toxin-antitoxin module
MGQVLWANGNPVVQRPRATYGQPSGDQPYSWADPGQYEGMDSKQAALTMVSRAVLARKNKRDMDDRAMAEAVRARYAPLMAENPMEAQAKMEAAMADPSMAGARRFLPELQLGAVDTMGQQLRRSVLGTQNEAVTQYGQGERFESDPMAMATAMEQLAPGIGKSTGGRSIIESGIGRQTLGDEGFKQAMEYETDMAASPVDLGGWRNDRDVANIRNQPDFQRNQFQREYQMGRLPSEQFENVSSGIRNMAYATKPHPENPQIGRSAEFSQQIYRDAQKALNDAQRNLQSVPEDEDSAIAEMAVKSAEAQLANASRMLEANSANAYRENYQEMTPDTFAAAQKLMEQFGIKGVGGGAVSFGKKTATMEQVMAAAQRLGIPPEQAMEKMQGEGYEIIGGNPSTPEYSAPIPRERPPGERPGLIGKMMGGLFGD